MQWIARETRLLTEWGNLIESVIFNQLEWDMPTKIKYVMKHGKDSTQLQFEVEHGEHQFVTLLPWSQTHVLVKNKGKPTNNNKILTQVFISLICKNDYIFFCSDAAPRKGKKVWLSFAPERHFVEMKHEKKNKSSFNCLQPKGREHFLTSKLSKDKFWFSCCCS